MTSSELLSNCSRKWHTLGTWVFLLVLTALQPAFSQWEMGAKYVRHGVTNCTLFLNYSGPANNPREFQVTLNFRPKGSYRVYMSRMVMLAPSDKELFSFDFNLEPGEYDIFAEIWDPRNRTNHSLMSKAPFVVPAKNQVYTSDIFLSFASEGSQALKEPLLVPVLRMEQNQVYVFVEVQSRQAVNLMARSLVYKEDAARTGQQVSTFTSLHQHRQILSLKTGKSVIFGDTIELNGLDPGEYLVSVSFTENNYLHIERNIRFLYGGDLRQRIIGDLGESVRMMRYLLPEATLKALMDQKDKNDQLEAFFQAWKTLYPMDTDAEMEAYYRKIFDANARFTERQAGWQSDRGRIYLKYGEPGQVKSSELNGNEFQRWTYPKWSLSFLFRKEGDEFRLVK